MAQDHTFIGTGTKPLPYTRGVWCCPWNQLENDMNLKPMLVPFVSGVTTANQLPNFAGLQLS